jgi:hypothetical protein
MLEHDPEKWLPVFRKDHAPTKSWSLMMQRREIIMLQHLQPSPAAPL